MYLGGCDGVAEVPFGCFKIASGCVGEVDGEGDDADSGAGNEVGLGDVGDGEAFGVC